MNRLGETAPGVLLDVEDTALHAYTSLLPDALDPQEDPVYAAPLAPIRWEAWPDRATGARLTVRPDTKTIIEIEKNAFGLDYTTWAVTYHGEPLDRKTEDGTVMNAEIRWPPPPDGIAARYSFERGGAVVTSRLFACVGFERPGMHEGFTLLQHLGAAITDATATAPEAQQEFVLEFRRRTGHKGPYSYGGRMAGSSLGQELGLLA